MADKGIREYPCSSAVLIRSSILLLSILFSPLVSTAQELSGTAYQTRYGIFCLGGPGTSSGNRALKNIIGATTGIWNGSAYKITTGPTLLPAALAADEDYLVSGLGALVSPGGAAIEEAVWQMDNDPYFYWAAPAIGLDILGYSYSLDVLPDDQIDTSRTYYYSSRNALIDGMHIFYVKAQRSSGIWGNPSSFNIWVDTTAPTVTLLQPALGEVISTDTPQISAVLSDTYSSIDPESIEMSINRAEAWPEYNPETGTVSFIPSTPLSDGEITVSLKVGDIVGNYILPLAWSFVIDTEGPSGSMVINNDDEKTTTTIVTLNISAQDETTQITEMILSNDGVFDTESWEPYTSLRKNWVLPAINGLRRVHTKVQDAAGNISQAFFDDINLVIIAPETFILSGPSGITQEQQAEFTFEGSVSGCQFSYKFDNQDWSPWSSSDSVTRSGLAEGNHYFMVRAAKDLNKDDLLQLDEVDPTPALRVWTISTTGILKPPAQPEKPIRLWEEE